MLESIIQQIVSAKGDGGEEEEEEEADQPCVPGVRSEGIKAPSFFPSLHFLPLLF